MIQTEIAMFGNDIVSPGWLAVSGAEVGSERIQSQEDTPRLAQVENCDLGTAFVWRW